MAENKSADDANFRVVPIEKDAAVGDEVDGEMYYRSRGDVVIQDAEIVSETPLSDAAEGKVFAKSSDVQHAAYQVENPPAEYETYEDYDGEAPQEYAADEDAEDDAPKKGRKSRKNRRSPSRPQKIRRWYQSLWLYGSLAAVVLIVLGALYFVSDSDYRAETAKIAERAAAIGEQLDTGSGKPGATIEDELDYYNDLLRDAQKQNDALGELNRRYWWILARDDENDAGLAALNEKTETLKPLLSNLGVFMQQVGEVVSQVLGTDEKPGHLLSALELSSAQDTLQKDRELISNALSLCAELEDLPEPFVKGRDNLEEKLRSLDDDTALLQEYLRELSGVQPQADLFCSAARDFYNRTFTDNLANDLQAEYNVIVRSDNVQEQIVAINEQSRYAGLHRPYGIEDMSLDEAGRQILSEEGAVSTARTILLTVRGEDEALAQNTPDAAQCSTFLSNNASYIQQLGELAMPDRYAAGMQKYLEALNVRTEYLNAYLAYAKAYEQVGAHASAIETLKNQRDALKGEIADALASGDMQTFRRKTDELNDVLDKIDDEREAYDAANAAAQPLLQEANRLHSRYSELANS